ncbi:MAG: cytochrome c [Elusimicrobia bacterium]|nr:cytochrome c [Elusimicrobiota bacterium]
MRTALAAVFLALTALSARAGTTGRELFDAHDCVACHRVGFRGGEAGPDLTLVGVRHARAWIALWLKSPHAWRPSTLMPEQGLSEADRAELATFLSEQKGQAWGERRPWDGLSGLAEGKNIYERAGCIACHGTAGRGGHPNPGALGGVIPALAPVMGTYTAAELAAKISNGSTPTPAGAAPAAIAMPAWKGILRPAELDALTQYLLSLAAGQPKTDW